MEPELDMLICETSVEVPCNLLWDTRKHQAGPGQSLDWLKHEFCLFLMGQAD